MATIRIVIAGHLCNAPRPQKEAAALAAAGHRVTVQGVWSDEALAQRDRNLLERARFHFEIVADLRQGHPGALRHRLFRRLASEAFRRAGHFSPASLGYGVRAHLAAARHGGADLTIVHSEGGLWVGASLLRHGHKVGVDFEDWFSEDLLPSDRISRPVHKIRSLERTLLRESSYRLTTSAALAAALAKDSDSPPPTVVYNVFPWAERNPPSIGRDRGDVSTPSLHWFSQTLGPGRGLEDLFAAMPEIRRPCQVHLRGNVTPENRRAMLDAIPQEWRERVHFHATVPNDELPARIASHDIGLALETDRIPSRDLTVTNKLFQYLLGGLAIVGTSTSGQREIAEKTGSAIQLVAPGDPNAIAGAINSLLSDRGRLSAAKRDAIAAAEREFCWEKQAGIVVEEAARTLRGVEGRVQ